jgi:hypothetical protein
VGVFPFIRIIKCKKNFDFQHKPLNNIKLPLYIEQGFKVLRKSMYIDGFGDNHIRKTAKKIFLSKEMLNGKT